MSHKIIITEGQFKRLNEFELNRVIRKVLNESLLKESTESVDFNALWNGYPVGATSAEIFPNIIPQSYQKEPQNWRNGCATKLSLALNKVGIKPPQQMLIEKDWSWKGNTYSKNTPLAINASVMRNFLIRKFGQPTFTADNSSANLQKVYEQLKNKSGVLSIYNAPWPGTTGHVDVFKPSGSGPQCAGGNCHIGEGGKVSFWVFGDKPITNKISAIEHLVFMGKDRETVASFDEPFVVTWAKASKSGQPTFVYNGKTHDTKTARVVQGKPQRTISRDISAPATPTPKTGIFKKNK